MAQRIQLRRGTAAEWIEGNPVLALGEPGIEKDTGRLKLGDGVTAWTALAYASQGEKGDQGVPGVADDASVKELIEDPTSETATVLSATYAPKDDGGYLLSCFRAPLGDLGGDQKLSILYSTDGKTFLDAGYAPVYSPTLPKVVRDPSIIYRNGTFFITHTNTGSSGTSFDIISSTNLLDWTLIKTVDASVIGGVTQTWAPEFVEDGNDVYIFFSINTKDPYWIKATDATMTNWTAPTALTITGRPTRLIDPVFTKKGSTWYCFYVDTDALPNGTPSIFRATASSVTGTYATDRTGDWAGFGTDYYEGPSIVRLHDGTFRLYLDRAEDPNDLNSPFYSDSTDLNTWTAPALLKRFPDDVPYKLRHGTVLPIGKEAAAKAANLGGTFMGGRFIGTTTDQNQNAPAGVYVGMVKSGGNAYPKLQLANGTTNVRFELQPNGELVIDKPGVANSEMLRSLTGRWRFGSAVQPKTYTTAQRPTGFDASVAGAQIWDSTIGAYVYWNGARWVAQAPNTARAQYNSSQTITSTSFVDFGLAVNFTPRGTKALVRLDGLLSTVHATATGLCVFRFAVTGATAGTVSPQGGLMARTTEEVRAVPGISTVLGSLVPGVEVTISVQVKVDSGVTAYCRPSTNSYEFLTITASDAS